MTSRPLTCEALESRENPVGPLILDPVAVPTVAAMVPVPSAVAPADTTANKILDVTVQAITQGW